MKATLAPLAGILCAALLVPALTGCGASAQAQSTAIASGGSALHVEREPRLAAHPAAFGAAHVNSEPLAGLVLFLAMRAQQAGHGARLAASPPCDVQQAGSAVRDARRPQTPRRDSSCADAD